MPELEGEEYTAFKLIRKDPAYDHLVTFMEQYEQMLEAGLPDSYEICGIIEFLKKTDPDLIARYNNERKGEKPYMNTLGMLVDLLSESKEALHARDIRIFDQDKTITRKDDVIRRQNARIKDQNAALSDRQAVINDQKSVISDQKSVINEQSEMITLMGSTISSWKKLASFLTSDALQAAAKSAGVNLSTLL